MLRTLTKGRASGHSELCFPNGFSYSHNNSKLLFMNNVLDLMSQKKCCTILFILLPEIDTSTALYIYRGVILRLHDQCPKKQRMMKFSILDI